MHDAATAQRNRRIGLIALAFAAGMVGLGYAAVPLYRIFCQKTGFAGTPARATEAEAAQVKATGQTIEIRFDANTDPNLPWTFTPEKTVVTVPMGERRLALFRARNNSDHTITGQASYNIEPEQAAAYFNKVQCFCFTQQTLGPHQEVSMPVIFYVDPKITKDLDANDVDQITLSYTFHESK
jgi:cytochrome c oxidase assembly protein subunit 11